MQTTAYALTILNELIEEAQDGINTAMDPRNRRALTVARDALTEAKIRIREGRIRPDWTKHLPPIVSHRF